MTNSLTKKKLALAAALASLPLLVGGLAVAGVVTATAEPKPQANSTGYVCPLTGEQLPCPNCCPLNK